MRKLSNLSSRCKNLPILAVAIRTLVFFGAFLVTGIPINAQQRIMPNQECLTFADPVKALAHEKKIAQQLAVFTKNFINQGHQTEAAVVIPIQIHIVQRNDGTGGVPIATVRSEITNFVNTRYASIDVSFLECAAENYINSTAYYDYIDDAEGDAMSAANNVANVLNIYFVNDPDGACGWARFTTDLPVDYIVIANSCADNTSTLAHEIGHYFDLFHTHETMFGAECVDGTNCLTAGDLLCDTPADPVLTGKVSAFPGCTYTGVNTDACNGDTYAPSTSNLMSYSQKECRTVFTAQQNAKILFTIGAGRNYLSFSCVGAPPPANDLCAGAININCNQTITGTTVAATIDAVSSCITALNSSPGVWYKFTGDGAGTTLSLCGSGYDTKIGVFRGSCAGLICVSGNDDFLGCALQSQVSFTTTPGTNYFILVTGFNGASGAFSLARTCCTLVCPANITVPNAPNQCGAVVNYTAPTATGNCGTLIGSPASGSFFPIGTTTVNFTSTGGGTCSFTVTVQDTQAPAVTCPANITVPNAPNQCGAVVTFTPTASDNCPGVTVSANPVSGSFFSVGTTTVTVTASDTSPNSPNSTCTFTVTVQDTQAPALGPCPANITAPNDLDQCGAVVSFTLPLVSDNCPGVTVTSSPVSGSFFPVGTTTVTVTASDASPNSPDVTCTFTVTVNDVQAPYIFCPNSVTVIANNDGSCTATGVAIGNATATDNCTPAGSIVITNNAPPAFPLGVTVVTWTATDLAGNSSTCSKTVTVIPYPGYMNQPPSQTVCANARRHPLILAAHHPYRV